MIKLENVDVQYESLDVLRNFNLEINEGQMIALCGRSGSGKTTILNLISGFLKPKTGTVLVNDKNVSTLNKKEHRKFLKNEISYLVQDFALLEDETIYENLEFVFDGSRKDKRDIVQKTLEKVNIYKDVDTLVYTLSGGEQQRIALARIMLKKSDTILADEPTGNVDVENASMILGYLSDLAKAGKTVVVVTHDTNFIEMYDAVIYI
ncbi:ATP-binding cassette domain-containing protein [Erysipelothrix inopinata]|uniref:ATP-binding cassette domain-containing protein n=1 Tax=Erysipelothrix inopinata TaxID=225084 RepID=A0A7G9S0W4_9FIRM|nr:ATP-binding cassette domain-containing protein [Erysipelothrix inopinata]QNN61489.1 ATP-binding cassette domain-containing protein [Erysipelothrix inopinata]